MSPTTGEAPAGAAYFRQLAAERPDIALCRASTAVARAAEAHAEAAAGLGVGPQLVLKAVAELGPSSQRALSDALRIDRSVMVGLCDGLERAGLVRRERVAGDRRAYAVTLTDAGRERLAVAERGAPALVETALAPLSAEERDQLAALLGRLL